ncbi:hypothetical protein EDB85DRAFT_1894114 [Lactarius pseudohatsudake]|nr:hypothetical protein EDB85DRAFT_1894114 [Lactarius pseudohatsudake]
MGCPSPQIGDFDSSEPAPPKTTCSKQDHATSHTKAPSTRSAKAKASRPTTTDDDNVTTQPQSKLRSVSPVSDRGCKSPGLGTQDPAGKAASSSEGSAATMSRRSRTRTSRPSSMTSLCFGLRSTKSGEGQAANKKGPHQCDIRSAKSEQPSKEDIESIVKEHNRAHHEGCIVASFLTRALALTVQAHLQSKQIGLPGQAKAAAVKQIDLLFDFELGLALTHYVTFKVRLASSRQIVNSKLNLSQWKVNKKVIDYQVTIH